MKTENLKVGQTVKVFTDPISCKACEDDNATINKVHFISKNTSFCEVTFEDGFVGDRFINNSNN